MITCLLLAYDKIEYFSVKIIFSHQSPVTCQNFNQNLVLFLYFHLVLLLKQNFVLCSYFHLVPQVQFHLTFVFKIPFRHFVCFGKIINCTAVQLMK